MLQVPHSRRQRRADPSAPAIEGYDGDDGYHDRAFAGRAGYDGYEGYDDRAFAGRAGYDGYDDYDPRYDTGDVDSVRISRRGRRAPDVVEYDGYDPDGPYDVDGLDDRYEYAYADPLHPAGGRRMMSARQRRPLAPAEHERERFVTMAVAAITVLALVGIAFLGGGGEDDDGPAQALHTVDAAAAPAAPISAAPVTTELPELDVAAVADASAGAPPVADATVTGAGCVMGVDSLRLNETGDSVTCLQNALIAGGFLTGPATGTFDSTTYGAVRQVQTERNLFVDGVVGRETAISLEIWPDEQSFVTRTPPPAPGAVDLMGYPLSSVASAGADAPPLPPNSGSGRRVVYERAGQRVWAVDDDEQIIRSWLVSGSKYSNEVPGTHQVYSRSDVSTAWNGKAWLPQMIRYYQTDIGHIGFHAIPLHRNDNSPYQTEAELGTRLSGGCQRQANADAAFLWDFAQVGTTVVVV